MQATDSFAASRFSGFVMARRWSHRARCAGTYETLNRVPKFARAAGRDPQPAVNSPRGCQVVEPCQFVSGQALDLPAELRLSRIVDLAVDDRVARDREHLHVEPAGARLDRPQLSIAQPDDKQHAPA